MMSRMPALISVQYSPKSGFRMIAIRSRDSHACGTLGQDVIAQSLGDELLCRHAWPKLQLTALYYTLALIVLECASVVFSAFLEFTMHCYRVVFIFARTCNASLTAVVTSCGSVDILVDRICDRSSNIRIFYSSEHSCSKPRFYLPFGKPSQNHFT